MTDPLLRDLIDIPERVHRSDFVIALAEGIDNPAETVRRYVVTDQLIACFDRALGLIDGALAGGTSKGAYLHGSFGAGKSHFMAMLDLLLAGDPHARGKPELAPIVAKYEPRLRGRRFLLVPFHMVGAASMEAGVLGGYVDHVRRIHPDAELPAVFVDQALLDAARTLRARMGDESFFAGLGGAPDEGFGDLAAGWDAGRFDAALADAPTGIERRALVSDLIETYFTHTSVYAEASGVGYVPFADGLDAVSQHARSLGYDAVILFLDELILWFASRMADPGFVNAEGEKVAKLVEAPSASRPAPVVSFIARQRDLRDFVGHGVPGAERLNFAEILRWWESRFDVIELSDVNLRAIVEQRLLEPRSEAARRTIDEAFAQVTGKAGKAVDTLLSADADRAAFRRVYPFSPALIETLVAVSGYLQRERTALRLLLQLLVDGRDQLRVGDLVPVGDLYDVIRSGEDPFSDELKRHFARAADLYDHRLRPMLLADYGLDGQDVAALPDTHAFRADDRLVKTLLLAALVPTVAPLRGMTVRRLADLNHGTITTPVPGAEKAAVLGRLRKWAPEVPELRLEGDDADPTVSLQLVGIDVQGIVDQAAGVDNVGARRSKIRELVAEAFGLDTASSGLVPETYTWVWRGSRRTVDLRFANVRDVTDIPDSELRAHDRPRVVVDFPFDDPGHGPADDLARVDELRDDGPVSATVCWLPLFLTEHALERLGRMVILDHILTGDRFDGFTTHLSPHDRVEARHLLENQAASLRSQLREVLRRAYGLEAPEERWVRTDLRPREQLPTLDPTLALRPPTAPSLKDALEQLLDQVMAHRYPEHPAFEEEVRPADLRVALRYVERAVSQRDGRVDVPQPDRKAVRKVLGPLRIATTGDAHLTLDRHWKDHFHRKQAEHPGVVVTVERLKRWIDDPRPMGLDDRAANLVVAAYVLSDNRVLVQAGRPVEPGIDRLEPTTEIRAQALPEPEEWQAAATRAAAVFGVAASPLLTAATVAKLVAAVKAAAMAPADACRLLTGALDLAASRLGVDHAADRLRTAQAARDLVDGLRSADDVGAIRLLARFTIPTTAESLGRSIHTAGEVAAALARVNWELVDNAGRLSGTWAAQGQGIGRRLASALERDELVQPLVQTLEDEERAATDLFVRATAAATPETPPAPAPPPTPPAAARAPAVTAHLDRLEARGSRTGLSGDEARRLLDALRSQADRLRSLDVTWALDE